MSSWVVVVEGLVCGFEETVDDGLKGASIFRVFTGLGFRV